MNLFRMLTPKSSLVQKNIPGGIVRYRIDDLNNDSVNSLVSNVIKYRVGRDPQFAQNLLYMAESTISEFRDNTHRKEFLRKLRKPGENKKTLWSLWRPEEHHSDTVSKIKRAYFESLVLSELENQEE